jgi:hypothetical protein
MLLDAPYAYSDLNVVRTLGDFTGNNEYYSVRMVPFWAPTNNLSKNIFGAATEVNLADTNTPSGDLTGSYVGGRFRVLNRIATVNVNKITGGEFMAWNLGADGSYGNVTTAIGGRFDVLRSGGTITNAYGMYIEDINEGTNNWAIYSVGGNNYFGGSVGIGTTSPQQKLHVNGSAVINGTLNMDSNKITSLGNGTSAQDAVTLSQLQTVNSTGNLTGAGVANRAAFWTGSDTLSYDGNFTWDNTNKRLGIGKTDPGGKLDISGSSWSNNVGGDLRIYGGSYGAGITLKPTTSVANEEGWTMYAGGSGSWVGDGDIGFLAHKDGGGTGSSDVKLVIERSGDVGINTRTPQNTLNVVGDGNFTGNLYSNNAQVLTSYTETDPLWTGNETNVARIGDCPEGQFVQNTTTGGVECTAPAGGGDITGVFTTLDNYLYNGSASGDVYLRFNETKLNETIDLRAVTSESDPLWTGNVSNVAFTNIDETFDESCCKELNCRYRYFVC